MTDELERMRAYAEAAREHPKLLAKLERRNLLLRSIARAVRGEADGVMEFEHLDELPKDIVGERRIWADDRARLLAGRDEAWHRLHFAEMVLDRLGAEIDGVPWREAARLSESLDGEPVTDAEPLAKRIAKQEHMAGHLIETCRWYAEDFAGPENEWRHFVGVEVPDQVMRIVTEPVAPASDPGVQSGD